MLRSLLHATGNLPIWFMSVFLILTAVSCEQSDPFQSENVSIHTPPDIPAPEFTLEEQNRIDEILNAGGLKVATSFWPGVIQIEMDGTYSGFHHTLVQEVAEVLNLPYTYNFMDFNDFFSRGGIISDDVKTNPNYRYDPDVFFASDIIAYDLTHLPWREKLMDFISVMPVRMLLLTTEPDSIVQLGDLQGKRGVVFANTSHETYLRKLNENLDLGIEIITRKFGEDIYSIVESGDADFCIRDSNSVLAENQRSRKLKVSMALGMEMENCWAVEDGDEQLKNVMDKTISYLRESGRLNQLFLSEYGLGMDEYFNLMDYNPENLFQLTDEETSFLEDLKLSGGIRAAMELEQSVLQVSDTGKYFGVHYNLALAVADLLDLPMEYQPVKFNDFFMKDGLVDSRLLDDPQFSYKPDLLESVDVYISTLSSLPWREKFLRFIEIYPTKLTYLVRTGEPEPKLSNVSGKHFITVKNTSYEDWILKNLNTSDITLSYVEYGLDQARMVSQGQADIALSDANIAITAFRSYPNLMIYPVSNEIDTLSWAVYRENEVLADILNKAMNHLRNSSIFDSIWRSYYYETSFQEYLNLLSGNK